MGGGSASTHSLFLRVSESTKRGGVVVVGGSAADALPRLSSSNAQNYRRFGSGPEQVLKLLQGRGPLLWP